MNDCHLRTHLRAATALYFCLIDKYRPQLHFVYVSQVAGHLPSVVPVVPSLCDGNRLCGILLTERSARPLASLRCDTPSHNPTSRTRVGQKSRHAMLAQRDVGILIVKLSPNGMLGALLVWTPRFASQVLHAWAPSQGMQLHQKKKTNMA